MKKQRLTQLICLMLAAMMLPSCGGTQPDAKNDDSSSAPTSTEPEETELTDNLPEKDMEGFELGIHHFDETWLVWAYNILDAET